MGKYKAMIGLEMHCQISTTNTKVFSNAKNAYNEIPNTNIKPLDMAFPGTLPTVNKEAVKKSLMASLILNCKQPEYLYFERKNYYYPDLPKGYQITQQTSPAPIGVGGSITFEVNGEEKKVRIDNIHLEEDAASTDHYSSYSTIDYNRAGVPLLELVTYPDLHSAEEAVAFLETMRSIYRYTGISEADSKKGQIRCDVNVSIIDENLDETKEENWGTKIEIKNVNSFGAVKDTILYEIDRQIRKKEDGTYDKMKQETRRWDEESETTIFMRSKVDEIDYKYFVEPNIPKIKLSKDWIESIRKEIPALAKERKEKYQNEYHLSVVDANILVKEKEISDYFDETIKEGTNPKTASNWITSTILGYLNKNDIEIKELFLTPKMLTKLIKKVEDKTISSKQGKEVLYKSLEEKEDPITIIEKLGLKQIGNEEEILVFVKEVLEEHLDMIEKYKNGRTNVIDFFVGQIMKKTKGKANPAMTMNLIKQEIEKR